MPGFMYTLKDAQAEKRDVGSKITNSSWPITQIVPQSHS